MAGRLHLKYGLVAEGDRLESSPDTILVTEPTAGTVLRAKGSLYTVVTARARAGGRPHEATALVAETVRREYYYDDSAGIPACLDKAVRSANRRLRHQREGQGLTRGSIGAVVAIVRGHELYVATIGEGEAYLVRQARLLTLPEEERGEGLPSPDDPHVDVWRGDLAPGDSLILVSRNLVRVVGTEELKNAVVTLHPQSAVEHLHHLFVAAGGEGSDAVVAVEATDGAWRGEPRPQSRSHLDDDDGARIPLPPAVASAVDAVGAGVASVQSAIAGAFWGAWDRIGDLLPRRRSRYRRVNSPAGRRDAQRRAAFAALGFVGVVTVVGLSAWYIGGVLANTERNTRTSAANDADASIRTARDRLDEVFGAGDLIADDQERATRLLREAWAALDDAAEAGATESVVQELRNEVAVGLNRLYRTHRSATRGAFRFEGLIAQSTPAELVLGRDGAAYAIDNGTGAVMRVDVGAGEGRIVATPGEGDADEMAAPLMLTAGGSDILILDAANGLWRWRPDGEGGGSLRQLPVVDGAWGEDVVDIGTFGRSGGVYNLYVVDPSARQVLVYEPAADGTGFPTDGQGRLSSDTDVADVVQMAIDGDIYLLRSDGLERYESGRLDGSFELETPPDDGDLREGHEWGMMAMTGGQRAGRIYLWDRKHRRIVEYLKSSGEYVQQFVRPNRDRDYVDLTGMAVSAPEGETPVLYWIKDGVMLATPMEGPTEVASPSPSGASPSSEAAPSP